LTAQASRAQRLPFTAAVPIAARDRDANDTKGVARSGDRIEQPQAGVPNSFPIPRATAVTHGHSRSAFSLHVRKPPSQSLAVLVFQADLEFDSRHSLHLIAPSQGTLALLKLFEQPDDKHDQAGPGVCHDHRRAMYRSALSGGIFGHRSCSVDHARFVPSIHELRLRNRRSHAPRFRPERASCTADVEVRIWRASLDTTVLRRSLPRSCRVAAWGGCRRRALCRQSRRRTSPRAPMSRH
jgi:hypothetical protein